MRATEWVLVAVVAGAVAWLGSPRRRPGWAAVAVAVAVAVQWLADGPRWQLVPVWAVAAVVAVLDLALPVRRVPAGRWRHPVAVLVGLLLAAAPLALPVPTLPAPDGPERVGTVTVELTDPSRTEALGPEAGGLRRITVQAWYPTDDAGTPATWDAEISLRGAAIAGFLGFPPWFLDHARLTTTHAIVDATPRPGRYPVVLYSHGWRGFRTIATDQAERLASHGFVVLAPDHTGGAMVTGFADGTVVEWDPAALPDADAVGEAAYDAAAEALVATFADDLALVLDALADGRLGAVSGAADPDVVGVYGHSTGGGAAVRLCLVDPRCDAVVGHDAWVVPIPDPVVELGLRVPALFQRSDGWRGGDNDRRLRDIAESAPSAWWQGIEGAGHNDFILLPLFSPLAPRIGLKGPIPADRVVPIVSDHLVAFMDTHLRGGPGATLDRSWPEVTTEMLGG